MVGMKKQNPSNKVLRRQETDFPIMQAIVKNSAKCSVEIGGRFAIDLGPAHYCLTAFAKAGWVKFGNFASPENKKQHSYILTPSGLAH